MVAKAKRMFSADLIKHAAKDKKPFFLEHAIVETHYKNTPVKRFWNKSFKRADPGLLNQLHTK